MSEHELEAREFAAAMQDVAKAFGTPAEIVRSNRLTRPQKLKLLQQWDYDLGLLLVASEENMTSPRPNTVAETLRQVRAALADMQAEVDSDRGAPGKVSAVHVPEIDDLLDSDGLAGSDGER